MNDKFDELAKGLAQSVTRRGAMKKASVGLGGIVLASLGLAHDAQARACKEIGKRCHHGYECCSGYCATDFGRPGVCM